MNAISAVRYCRCTSSCNSDSSGNSNTTKTPAPSTTTAPTTSETKHDAQLENQLVSPVFVIWLTFVCMYVVNYIIQR